MICRLPTADEYLTSLFDVLYNVRAVLMVDVRLFLSGCTWLISTRWLYTVTHTDSSHQTEPGLALVCHATSQQDAGEQSFLTENYCCAALLTAASIVLFASSAEGWDESSPYGHTEISQP